MPDRVANLTVPHNGRPACHYCDQCQRGCHTASYFNSPSVTLPAAARTGRFTLLSDAVVSHVMMNDEGERRGCSLTSTALTKRMREGAREDHRPCGRDAGIDAHSAQFALAAVSQTASAIRTAFSATT